MKEDHKRFGSWSIVYLKLLDGSARGCVLELVTGVRNELYPGLDVLIPCFQVLKHRME